MKESYLGTRNYSSISIETAEARQTVQIFDPTAYARGSELSGDLIRRVKARAGLIAETHGGDGTHDTNYDVTATYFFLESVSWSHTDKKIISALLYG